MDVRIVGDEGERGDLEDAEAGRGDGFEFQLDIVLLGLDDDISYGHALGEAEHAQGDGLVGHAVAVEMDWDLDAAFLGKSELLGGRGHGEFGGRADGQHSEVGRRGNDAAHPALPDPVGDRRQWLRYGLAVDLRGADDLEGKRVDGSGRYRR